MNNKELFHINKILLVAHGGNHNDTIATVSVKKTLDKEDSNLGFAKTTSPGTYEQLLLF